MADCGTFHDAIVDSADIHEPKNVPESTTANQIIVTNGDGPSGTSSLATPAESAIAITVLGQTGFALANTTPLQGTKGLMRVEVNGVDEGNNFTIVGQTLTYTGTDYLLDTTDVLNVVYFYK